MALSANTVWECRVGGSDQNGGGFVTGASGTDWSQQDAAQYSVTDGVTNGTTTITSATANFGTDVVGNIMYVQGGTGSITAGWYQITSRTNSTTIVVDRSTGLTSGTGVTLKIGGALATPGNAAALATVSGMVTWVKSGTYNFTTATPGAAGPVVFANVTRLTMEGYQTTRGDRTGTRPVVSWAAVSAPGATTYIFANAGTNQHNFLNLTADGNDVSNVSGFDLGNAGTDTGVVENCVAQNCSGASQIGFTVSLSHACISCYANDCTTGFNGSTGTANNCTAKLCGTGFTCNTFDCIANACVTDGFKGNNNPNRHIRGTAYGTSAGDGFDHGNSSCTFIDCVAVGNSAYGFNGVNTAGMLFNCAAYNNTSGRVNGTPRYDFNPITLSGDPFVAAGSDDFRPDATASEGASLRDAALNTYGQTDTRDIGAVQHTDPAGGGGSAYIIGG